MILKVVDGLHYLLFDGIRKVRVTEVILYRYDRDRSRMYIAGAAEDALIGEPTMSKPSELRHHEWHGLNTDGATHWGHIMIPKMSHGGEVSFLCGGDVFILNDAGDTIDVVRIVRSKVKAEIVIPAKGE